MLLPRQPQEKPGNEATLFVPFYQAVHTGTKIGLCSRSVLCVHSHSSHVPSYIITLLCHYSHNGGSTGSLQVKVYKASLVLFCLDGENVGALLLEAVLDETSISHIRLSRRDLDVT